MFRKTIAYLSAVALTAGVAGAAVADEIEYFRTDTPEFMASAKAGKQLFEAYQCALCHATRDGEPLTKDIIAPNLILSKERLRPEWILEWIIDPQRLQPGTKMPNFFSFNTDDNDNNILSDVDAHNQFKMIVQLRDYLMILGTDKEAELATVGDDGQPLADARRNQGGAVESPSADVGASNTDADADARDADARDAAASAPDAQGAAGTVAAPQAQ